MRKKMLLVLVLVSVARNSFSQSVAIVKNLKNTIYYLADDKLEGRNTGSPGEKLASDFIIKQYKSIGILPKGDSGTFIQSFHFNYGKKLSGSGNYFGGDFDHEQIDVSGQVTSTLHYSCHKLILGTDYFPLVNSNSKVVVGFTDNVGYGIVSKEKGRDDFAGHNDSGRIVLIQISTPDGDNPHNEFYPFSDIETKIKNAEAVHAAAIIFYNTNEKAENLKFDLTKTAPTSTIPIIFISDSAYKKLFFGKEKVFVDFGVALQKNERVGQNVCGFIDNGAKTTVVIGAHYDHLGLGQDGNSLYVGPPAIHNGADDNASGTAAVIELARLLKKSSNKKNNYLFLNFSGEELGLIGSNYWINHATMDTATINYMMNMDMVGRYRADKGMDVEGLGTSPSFAFVKTFPFDTLKLKYSDKGTGPTDHTSFYNNNIPVLNFFTGTHDDYHKPSDDANKINYSGEATIVIYINALIDSLNNDGTLSFSKTAGDDSGGTPKYTVRLGIIPDYLFEGTGLRVDGVSPNMPAEKAGILKGDVIIKMGDLNIADINTYMKGLSMFMKGDMTIIKVKRGEKEFDLPLTF